MKVKVLIGRTDGMLSSVGIEWGTLRLTTPVLWLGRDDVTARLVELRVSCQGLVEHGIEVEGMDALTALIERG